MTAIAKTEPTGTSEPTEPTETAETADPTGPAVAGPDDAAGDDIAGDVAVADADAEPGTGTGAAAFGIVSAALGLVSLTGSWLGDVVSQRETLIGQIKNPSTPAQQITELYGDAWHSTALVNGLFALLALLVGLTVLALPAFGAPGRPRTARVRATAWAGVALGLLGLLLSGAMYFDLLLALPATP